MEENTNIVGIDISDSTIKVLQIDSDRNVISYGSSVLPRGVVFTGKILKKEKFRDLFVQALKHAHIDFRSEGGPNIRIIVNLPEEKLFTYYMTIPEDLTPPQIGAYVRKEAAKVIPYNLENMSYDYLLIEGKGPKDALFVSVQKEYIDNYAEAITFGNIELSVVGSELFALGRSLLSRTVPLNAVVVDIGNKTTNIGIFDIDYVMHLSVTKRFGGTDLTKAIADNLGISLSAAEEMKRRYGVLKQHDDKKSPSLVRSEVDVIVFEVGKAISYFQERTGEKVGSIILTGGSALMPGIIDHMREKTGIETVLGNPFTKVKNPETFGKDNPPVFFSNVIGLVLRSLDKGFPQINLLDIRKEENRIQKERDTSGVNVFGTFGAVRRYVLQALTEKGKFILSSVLVLFAIGVLLYVIFAFT